MGTAHPTLFGDPRPALVVAKTAAHDAVLRRTFDRWEARDFADLAWSWQIERAGGKRKASAGGVGTEDSLDQVLADYSDQILSMA